MVDKVNPNRKNRLSPKDVLKRTAALTLLLSTVACSLLDNNDGYLLCGVITIALIGFVGHLKIVTGKSDEKKESNDDWSSYGGGRNGPDQ
jgi:hypothetical protein